MSTMPPHFTHSKSRFFNAGLGIIMALSLLVLPAVSVSTDSAIPNNLSAGSTSTGPLTTHSTVTSANSSPLDAVGGRSTGAPVIRMKNASAFSPVAGPILTATKTDNTSAAVNPGDTIMYTITIQNTGPDPATGVQFTDTIDANTTLDAASVKTTPVAVDDAYTALGNVGIVVPAGQGVKVNDFDPDGDTFNVSGPATTTGGGTLTLAADGSFTYVP